MQVGFCKHISWNSCNMFLYQGFTVYQVIYLVWGQDLFQFQAINSGCIGPFNVKIIVHIIQAVHNPDPERMRIAKGAIFNFINVFMLHNAQVT
ncbi:hypothetical protein D3C87_1767440 [compost metagenome]